MSGYKAGGVAALFSKPKEPTSESGKKLQSLFKQFHSKNKSGFQAEETRSKWNNNKAAENEESGNQGSSKKNRKRKFSATVDPELSPAKEIISKKFKGTDTQEEIFTNEKKKKRFEKIDFPRKKQKKIKSHSFNSNSYNESEIEKFENETESSSISEVNNNPKQKKKKSGFIKKSKPENSTNDDSFNKSQKKNPKVTEGDHSDDESFKQEVKEFIDTSFKKSKKNKINKANLKNDSFIVKNSPNKHEEEEVFQNNSTVKREVSDFVRRPKNRKKAISSSFESNDDANLEMSDEKAYDKGDDLFTSEKGDNVKKAVKKQKKKKSSKNAQNVTTKDEPHFAKLLDTSAEDDDKLGRTLFVGNLPLNTRLNELNNLFSTFGEIEFIRFRGVETDKAKIFNENAPKSLKANYAADSAPAFILFKERESAVNALTLCGTVFKNRHITVDFALAAGSKKLYDEKRSIFIGNLPFDVQDESIWNAFEGCGSIEGVRVVRDKGTGIGKGFGYVLFSTMKSKENALSLEDLQINGRTIRIKPVNSNKQTQKSKTTSPKTDTFKSHAIRLKKNNTSLNSRKSIKKLVKKEKTKQKKKQIASLLQKSMK